MAQATAILDPDRPALITVSLKDKAGLETEIPLLVDELIKSVNKCIQSKNIGALRDKTYPLAASITALCCDRTMHQIEADLVLHTSKIRDAMILSTLVGMYMMSALEKKGLKIHTCIEKLTADEADRTKRQATAISVIAQTAPLGVPAYATLASLLAADMLLEEDLIELKLNEAQLKQVRELSEKLRKADREEKTETN